MNGKDPWSFLCNFDEPAPPRIRLLKSVAANPWRAFSALGGHVLLAFLRRRLLGRMGETPTAAESTVPSWRSLRERDRRVGETQRQGFQAGW